MKKNIKINSILFGTFLLVLETMLFSCSDDVLEKFPLDELSNTTFWKSESDAMRGLTSCYWVEIDRTGSIDFYQQYGFQTLDNIAGLGSDKGTRAEDIGGGNLSPVNEYVGNWWTSSYEKIAICNNFIKNVETCEMDADEKKTMVAEAKFLRAYTYFHLGLYFGNVPLVEDVLNIEEANNVVQSAQGQVFDFAKMELISIVNDLPTERPANELGRVTKGAALAILGRIQMYEKKWTDASQTYKTLIDLGQYGLFPNYPELFWEVNENNNEIIFSTQYVSDVSPTMTQKPLRLMMMGGWHSLNVYNNLVETFECIDGKTIGESPLYEPLNPYENRDPRLDYTVYIPGRTVAGGMLYVADPNSDAPDRLTRYSWTGYAPRKHVDENYYPGDRSNYGGNAIVIRYAEILLSYLESVLESGASIDQSILDNTINLVRGRSTVEMPPIIETDTDKLRKIIRRERVCELAFESGLHYYDILRWGTIGEVNNGKFYGMKLTDDPTNYTDFPVNENGYYFYAERKFKIGVNELWPIPQTEMDINENMVQNPGY